MVGKKIFATMLILVLSFCFCGSALAVDTAIDDNVASKLDNFYSQIDQLVVGNTTVANAISADNINNIESVLAPVVSNANTLQSDDYIAVVNGWPITNGELEYRIGMRQAYGDPYDINTVFNRLVEEKVILSQAAEYGVLPTVEDVQAVIEEHQQAVQDNTEFGQAIEMLIDGGGYDTDDFWQVVEPYHQFINLASDNLAKAIYEEGVEDNSISATNKALDMRTNYWNHIFTFKQNADIVTLQEDTQYLPDLNQTYTFSTQELNKSDVMNKIEDASEVLNAVDVNEEPSATNQNQLKVARASTDVDAYGSATAAFTNADVLIRSVAWAAEFRGTSFIEANAKVVTPMDIVLYPRMDYGRNVSFTGDGYCVCYNKYNSEVAKCYSGWTHSLYFNHVTPYAPFFGKGHSGFTITEVGSQYLDYKIKLTAEIWEEGYTPLSGGVINAYSDWF